MSRQESPSSGNTPDAYADLIITMIPRFENNARLHAYLADMMRCARDEAIEECAAWLESRGKQITAREIREWAELSSRNGSEGT